MLLRRQGLAISAQWIGVGIDESERDKRGNITHMTLDVCEMSKPFLGEHRDEAGVIALKLKCINSISTL
jgi:hypothetical protein